VLDTSGNCYISEAYPIRKVSSAGVVSTLAGSPWQDDSVNGTGSAARFSNPRGLVVDSGANLFVADAGSHTIRKVSPLGEVTTVAGSLKVRGDADGASSAARFNQPTGIARDSSGNLYVSEEGNHTIRKITSEGIVTTIAGSTGQVGASDGRSSTARFNSPNGIVLDAMGHLLVADTKNHIIRRVSPAGLVTTIGGLTGQISGIDGIGQTARFSEPTGIAISSTGLVYVTDNGNNRIVVGTPISAAAINPPFTTWRVEKFNTTSTTGIAANTADPDGDGYVNLMEYALNGNPLASSRSIQPVMRRAGNLLRLNYTRRTDALVEGVVFTVEWSANVSTGPWSTIGVSEVILSDDGTTQDVEASVPAVGTKMFLRLRVER
jgi:NHL repeat